MPKRANFWMAVLFTFFLTGIISINAQQPSPGENEYRLAAVNMRIAGTAAVDTITSDAGRGMTVAHNPDLDGDGLPELIVTEYQKGGRVFVYEMIGNDMIELVWVSPEIHPTNAGAGSTPRTVTVGDFDNNGKMEIIFPIGYTSDDSFQVATRGIYFYEHTGNDNDYGTEPAYRLTYEDIDAAFSGVAAGRTESGLRVQDIDGDGRNELLFPPRAFSFSVAKLYILQVTSGTFADGNAVVENEYVYEAMVQPQFLFPDGYVPVGTDIGDVDNDGFDEIIVAGWQNIGAGAGLGFIQIDGEDTYTDGSVLPLANFSAFVVKANPIFTVVNGNPAIFFHGTNAGTSESKMWVVKDIIADNFVTESNIYEINSGVGFWSAWALGNQDHPTTGSTEDGFDLYLYGGGGRLLDIEYDGSGDLDNPASYTTTQMYDLSDAYDNVGGLFNDIYTFPGMDLDNDGLRDVVAAYKGSTVDTLAGQSLARDGFHVFFWEWGDSASSIDLPGIVGIEDRGLSVILPEDYQLSQNYPNPFNPTTKIDFTLPINKKISLKIYNTLGQEVRTLISEQEYAAGTYTVQWDATDNSGQKVASGVYLYKLEFGNFSTTKRMTLVR